jgi:hypothetical protein
MKSPSSQHLIKRYTLTAAASSVLLIGLFAWWFQASGWLVGLYALIASAITLTVPLLYRFFGYKNSDELAWLQAHNLRTHHALITRLEWAHQALVELNITEGIQQVGTLMDILDAYRAVVETRFVGKTFTPLTYLNAARSVQEYVVQNLTDMVAVGHSLAGISHQQDQPDQAERYQAQQQRLSDLLQENHTLFTALTETAVEIANIRSISQFERLDTLTRLISIAQTVNHTGRLSS